MSLEDFSKKVRIHVLNMTSRGKSSHIGSALSIVDILAVLYNKVMNIDPEKPEWPDRDRFILSKGHAGAAVYATLAERGFFSTELLSGHYQDGSNLSGHVSHKGIPGVEFSTGSLGHGLNVGVGIAMAAKMDGKAFRTFVLLSDGECDEGSNWEAILFAAHHKLDNLVCLVDYNKIQSLDSIENTIALEPFTDKWRAFNWNVVEADGHSHENIEQALKKAEKFKGKPTVVICHTTKGKGVSFMENTVLWHYRTAQGDEYNDALKELENQ
ncbi:MAG: transketolase [Bdellovibrionales bacterium]|nr:transketolase [Bdellovibrionales bacterium]